MRDKIIKFFDATIARWIVWVLGIPARRRARTYPSFDYSAAGTWLVVRPGGIGDAVLCSALVRRLARDGKTVDVVCMTRNAGIFRILRKAGMVREIFAMESVVGLVRLSRRAYDAVLDTEQSFYASALIARIPRTGSVIGFDTNIRRDTYDAFVRYSQERDEAESFLSLLEPFGIAARPSFPTPEELGLPEVAGLEYPRKLAIFTGASMAERLWPIERWIETLAALAQRFDAIVITGGRSETANAAAIAARSYGIPVIDLAGKLALAETWSVLAGADTVISTDSGPLHMASVIRNGRTYGIFGPGIAEKWGKRCRPVRLDLHCIGCNYGRFSQTPPCPYRYACLRDLPSDAVTSAILRDHDR